MGFISFARNSNSKALICKFYWDHFTILAVAEQVIKVQGILEEENSNGENLRQYGLPDIMDIWCRYLVRLLEHPWFSRIWVIQESLVATKGRFAHGD